MPDANFERYLEEVAAFPVPDSDTKAALLSDARQGDEVARKRLIEGLLAFIANAATAGRPEGMPAIDAIQEANVVLTRLVDNPAVPDPRAVLRQAVAAHLRSL